jgi:hypothetical protein
MEADMSASMLVIQAALSFSFCIIATEPIGGKLGQASIAVHSVDDFIDFRS